MIFLLVPLRWMLYQGGGAQPVILPDFVIASLDVAGARLGAIDVSARVAGLEIAGARNADSDLTRARSGDLAIAGARIADLEED